MVVFFLGPLAGLLLLTRPSSRRQWLWLATIAAWAIIWAMEPGGVADQSLRAAGVLFTGAFVIATLAGRGSLLSQSLWAAVAAAGGTAVLCLYLGIGWRQIEMAIQAKGWDTYRMVVAQLTRGGMSGSGATAGPLGQLATSVGTMAAFTPAVAALLAVAGSILAVRWRDRIVGGRVATQRPFREFAFSDHLVWAVIAGLGVYLAPFGYTSSVLALNALAVLAVLYGIRGVAIVWAIALDGRGWRLLFLAVVAGTVFFAFVAPVMVLLGLADTWIGFRRRMMRRFKGESR
jgi:hypothetical protein